MPVTAAKFVISSLRREWQVLPKCQSFAGSSEALDQERRTHFRFSNYERLISMLARLGNALYWLGCIVGALLVGLGVWVWFLREHHGDVGTVIMLTTFAIAFWLIGRACRYILAGT
jgi:hypothetical protein